ncbi:WD40-repeat-containing domain protein [Globomyces pollinis-pini]|nr:WD40-repeat-containing domain protein [Globomyces pollinis-pini]
MILSHRKKHIHGILFINFRLNYILYGTISGFRIYSNSGQLKYSVENDPQQRNLGGIGGIDVLESSNLFALIAGGPLPKFDLKRVILWDDAQKDVVAQLDFSLPVKAVCLRNNRLIVVFHSKIVVYSLSLMKQILSFDTYWNEHAIFYVSESVDDRCILAFPSKHKGQIQIVDIGLYDDHSQINIPYSCMITGHSSSIASLSLSADGKLLATSSKKGTLIRIWNTKGGVLLHELRRGTDEADIYSIAFSADNCLLCVTSDKGTLHLFNLEKIDKQINQSSQSTMSSYLPKYFSSDWSLSQSSIPVQGHTLLEFSKSNDPEDIVVDIVGSDGSFFKVHFNLVKGGEGAIQSYRQLFKKS